jgi:hypothetical protein
MEGDRQGVGTDKEGGERVKGGTQGGGQTGREDTGRGDTGRGDRQGEGMDREGIQTRRGYEQGGDTDRMRGGRRSWNRGWGGGFAVVRASSRVVVVVGARCALSFEGGDGRSVMVVRERGAIIRGWEGCRCPCELEGVGRGGRSLGAVVRGSRVVGWVFGCGPWDLDFVLAMERARGHSPKERRQRTTIYYRRSSSGCHVAIGT